MRIQHNIMAMNAYRNYNTNTSALSKNLEKLSSGYKINRAGDDAAGLAISEKMRAQITGLNAAQKNVKDGISLVKTAEGAMQEIQDMLNRMDYLATQSANGTYDNEVDRANLQKEVDALKSEIDRIADSANFNGIKLLNGEQNGTVSSEEGTVVSVSGVADAEAITKTPAAGVYTIDLSNWEAKATANGTVSIQVGSVTVAKVTVAGASANTPVTIKAADLTKAAGTSVTIGTEKFTVSLSGTTLTLTMKSIPTTDFDANMDVSIGGTNTKVENQGLPGSVKVEKEAVKQADPKYAQGEFDLATLGIKDGSQLKIGNEVYTFKVGADSKVSGKNVVDLSKLTQAEIENASVLAKEASRALSKAAANNSWFKVTSPNDDGTVHLTEKTLTDKPYKNDMVGTAGSTTDADWNGTGEGAIALVRFSANGGLGSSSTDGGLTLQIGDTSDSYNQLNVVIGDMHTSALGIDGLDISNPTSAASAIQTIRDAINQVSSVRGDLGAVQNRLEHTANNLSVMAENIQDAESTIRDTDVAEEMMAYTKNNILIQSAQAMLAQANAVPQGVLQLLG